MTVHRKILPLFLIICCGLMGSLAQAKVKLPHIFGDHMVIQRDCPVPVWGKARPKEAISIHLGPHLVSTQADARGRWYVELPALEAGGPHQMRVEASNSLVLEEILVGEVWLCAGQCNMDWPLKKTEPSPAENETTGHPQIRLFQVPKEPYGQPIVDVIASWFPCTDQTAGDFSGVAFYFGRELHRMLDVPIGLIQASHKLSCIDAWIPFEGFASVPCLSSIPGQSAKKVLDYEKKLGPALDRFKAWIHDTRAALDSNEPIPSLPDLPRHPLKSHQQPTGLFNGMIHPLMPFAIRGAIWYQGEQDIGETADYDHKMEALIRGWRNVWGRGDFPFYFVQLAPYCYGRSRPTEDAPREYDPYQLPRMWEAQSQALRLPSTGMVVTTDIGNLLEIHPPNKQEVGRRLALWALARDYGHEGVVCSGPLFCSTSRVGSAVCVHFEFADSGLITRDGESPDRFELAGPKGAFFPAQARIDGSTVILWNEDVTDPKAIRFGWHQEAQPNLMNQERLPASPFRAVLYD